MNVILLYFSHRTLLVVILYWEYRHIFISYHIISFHFISYHIISYTKYIDDSIICSYIYKHAPNFDHKPICIRGLLRILS